MSDLTLSTLVYAALGTGGAYFFGKAGALLVQNEPTVDANVKGAVGAIVMVWSLKRLQQIQAERENRAMLDQVFEGIPMIPMAPVNYTI